MLIALVALHDAGLRRSRCGRLGVHVHSLSVSKLNRCVDAELEHSSHLAHMITSTLQLVGAGSEVGHYNVTSQSASVLLFTW
jgi:hypothetical protein